MTKPQLLVDLTQFVRQPATTGIQRVLVSVLRGLAVCDFDVQVGYQYAGQFSFVELPTATAAVSRGFEVNGADDNLGLTVWNSFETAKTYALPVDAVPAMFDMYFLPEPTFLPEVLVFARRMMNRVPTAALVYDILPSSHAYLFRGQHHTVTDAYFQLVAEIPSVAAISEATLKQVELRLRQEPLEVKAVLRPPITARHRPRPTGPDPSLVHVGTVEPRKQLPVILDAVEQLWAAGENFFLTLIGAAGWEDPAFLSRLRELSSIDPRLVWHESANDVEVAELVSKAHGAIYISSQEGFGLPPLEALSLGVPVIVSSDLPALEGLSENGQIRLEEVTVASVRDAIRRIVDDGEQALLRQGARTATLPTHDEFVVDMSAWLTLTLEVLAYIPSQQVSSGA